MFTCVYLKPDRILPQCNLPQRLADSSMQIDVPSHRGPADVEQLIVSTSRRWTLGKEKSLIVHHSRDNGIVIRPKRAGVQPLSKTQQDKQAGDDAQDDTCYCDGIHLVRIVDLCGGRDQGW